jgi:NAD(P)-dependent dehydrogenase (short-subunit alcohol dehydrogenase family)
LLDLLIVSGSSRGIGRKIVEDLSVLSRRTLGISSSRPNWNVLNESIEMVQADLKNFQLVECLLKQKLIFSNKNPKIGIALCAAQIGEAVGIFDANFSEWNDLLKINLLGNLAIVKAVINSMPSDSKLRVVFFAGGGAAYGYPDFFGYGLSKVAVVRAVENIGIEFEARGIDASIIALAPGAVATDMLAKVIANGGHVKTRTEIDEPVRFVANFLLDKVASAKLNGRFCHVRDEIHNLFMQDLDSSKFKLRRIE